jgi:hypothetical protein
LVVSNINNYYSVFEFELLWTSHLGHLSCIWQRGYISLRCWLGSSSTTVVYVDGDMASWIESARLLCKAMLPLPSDVAQKIFDGATYATYIQLKYNFVLWFSWQVAAQERSYKQDFGYFFIRHPRFVLHPNVFSSTIFHFLTIL